MPWYGTGTVAVTANSATVTGTSTAFSANARVGDAFRGPDGRWYEITNIASATVLSIRPNYQGATASGQAYTIAPMQGYVKESADRLRQLVDQFGSQLAALQPWAYAATASEARESVGAAPIASPTFTGDPRAPTPAATDNDTSIATTAHVKAAMALFGVGSVYPSLINIDLNEAPALYPYSGRVPAVISTQSTNVPAVINQLWYLDQLLYSGGTATQELIPYRANVESRWIRTRFNNVWSAWYKVFSSKDILGTVANTNGIPTGAIIERGSNANGEYVRFADGTQFCTKNNTAITTDPAAFVGTPTNVDGSKLKIGRWY